MSGEPVEKQVAASIMEILQKTMPFQVVSEGMLRKIAALGRRVSFDKDALVYDVEDKADDIYIIVRGQVEHALEPGAQALRPVTMLGAGDVFGWAALLDKFPHRLARAVCRQPAEIVRINSDELLRLLESEPETAQRPSAVTATPITRLVCPSRVAVQAPASRSHTRTVPSCEPEMTRPSATATASTKSV